MSYKKYLYLGRWYSVRVAQNLSSNDEIRLYKGKLIVNSSDSSVNNLNLKFGNWYEERAKDYSSSRLQKLIKNASWVAKGHVPKIRNRKMKSAWGSCSPKGVITINTHLIKAPKVIIDYVIAHELCHLAEQHHTSKFHALLKSLVPNAETIRNRLKLQGHLYLTE